MGPEKEKPFSAIKTGLKLIFCVAATELSIMAAFDVFEVRNWIPPAIIDLIDTTTLSLFD